LTSDAGQERADSSAQATPPPDSTTTVAETPKEEPATPSAAPAPARQDSQPAAPELDATVESREEQPVPEPVPDSEPPQEALDILPIATLPEKPHPDDRPVLVLLDSLREVEAEPGATKSHWRNQLEVFASRFRVVTLPMPPSVARDDNETIRRLADVVEETLKRRGINEYGLAAYGNGGNVAIEVAARGEQAVAFLILVDVLPRKEVPSGLIESAGENLDEAARIMDPVDKLTMPVLVFFRADLVEVRSAQEFLTATGFDLAERVRVRRISAKHPILETAAENINRRLTAFLDDVESGRTIVKEQRVKLESGLSYIDNYVGDGPVPKPGQTMTVRWRMRLKDGTDVTPCGGFALRRTIALDESLIPGLREGLSTMRVGGKRKLFIPAKLAYKGKGDTKRIPPGAALTADVVLIDVSDEPPPPSKPSWNKTKEQVVNEHVRIIDRKIGEGAEVKEDSIVTFGYKLWSDSGQLVRSTAPGRPKHGVLRDINYEAKVWSPGMIGMRPGGERLIIGNAEFAFGDKLLPGICSEDDIVFRIKLSRVESIGPRPVLTPVYEEQYTELRPGLKYYDIKVGHGKSPIEDSAIVVHYAFWPDKHKDNPLSCLDSSRMRREPYVTLLSLCPQSWKDCLPSMKVGGHRQMKLQYDGVERAGVNKGDWVIYEIELLRVLTPQQYENWRKRPPGRFPWANR